MASSSTEKKMIVLISMEGQTFEVEEAAARLSQTVKNMIEDRCTAGGIPLPNVDSPTLAKVIEFCNRHAARDTANCSGDKGNLKKFNSAYIESVKDDQKMLFDLILAANYLDIRLLQNLMCDAVADIMLKKTPEEIGWDPLSHY